MTHHDWDDDEWLVFWLAGTGKGWFLVFTTCVCLALLAWHYVEHEPAEQATTMDGGSHD